MRRASSTRRNSTTSRWPETTPLQASGAAPAPVQVAENERDLSLLISRLEDFAAKVTAGLAGLDRTGMRQIIRSVVRQVEIDNRAHRDHLRVPPLDGPGRPKSPRKGPVPPNIVQTFDRAHLRLARTLSPARQRFRGDHLQRRGMDIHRLHSLHATSN